MKKKIIIITAIIIAALVIPIPKGGGDEGATTLSALTYKLVKWNRVYEGDLCYNSLKAYPFPKNLKSTDELWAEIAGSETAYTVPGKEAIPSEETVKDEKVSENVTEIDTCYDEDETFLENSDDVLTSTVVYPGGSPEEKSTKKTAGKKNDKSGDIVQGETSAHNESHTQLDISWDEVYRDKENSDIAYIRFFPAYETKTDYPHFLIIKDKSRYDEFCHDSPDISSLGQGGGEMSADSLANNYDESFFKDKCLLIIATMESSGSYRYVKTKINGSTVTLMRQKPEVFTCDMAYWYTFIELDKSSPIIADPKSITVEITDIK